MAFAEKALKVRIITRKLIDKFKSAADGINQDMALAEKALKVRTI
jgi:hypothetical protein